MLTLRNAVLKIPQLISTARRPYILEVSGKSALAHDYPLGS
jgi:hypothetical protein